MSLINILGPWKSRPRAIPLSATLVAIPPASALYSDGWRFFAFQKAAPDPAPAPAPAPAPSAPVPLGIPGNWKLGWRDEFAGSAIDTAAWNVATVDQPGPAGSDGGPFDPSLVGVGGGLLSLGLTAQGQSLIWSKATVKYGVVEARIWGPGSGRVIPNWPAFWMTTSKGDWPTGGEIDIWEPIVGRPGIHLHYGHDPNHPTVDMHPAGDWTGWHTYAVNWQPNGMTFWWDGKAVGTITEGVDAALSPMWVILNHHPASPGAWAGTDGWPASVPAQVLVDYVRVWS